MTGNGKSRSSGEKTGLLDLKHFDSVTKRLRCAGSPTGGILSVLREMSRRPNPRRAAESPDCEMANDRRVKYEWEHFEV